MATAYLLACSLIFLQGISVGVGILWSGASGQPASRRRAAMVSWTLTATLGAFPLIYLASKVLAYGPAELLGLLLLTLAFTVIHGIHAMRQVRTAQLSK